MFYLLVAQMTKQEGITEKLKAENQMEWVVRMNIVQMAAQEVVNNDLIFI